MIGFFLIFNVVLAQTDSDRIKTCLSVLYQDQAQFIKTSGHYAAHVDLLENSEKDACFGVSLKLSRKTVKDYNIQGSMNDEIWQINHQKVILKVGSR